MATGVSKSHGARNLALYTFATFLMFLLGSAQVLFYLIAKGVFTTGTQLGPIFVELTIFATLLISLIAIPLGYAYMYFFGGVLSTKAIRLYLFLTRGKTVIATKNNEIGLIRSGRGFTLALKRQIIYFVSILAVVVSFAIYLSRHGIFPIATPLSRTSDALVPITRDYITLAILGSLMLPIVALVLPYFGGLRLRTIDVGPFHTTVLSFVIGASGGFTLLYSLLARPVISLLIYYLLLFMGVCWCFAIGCNLGADPANRHIIRDVLRGKSTSQLITSKIWIESSPGKLVEV